MGINYTLQLIHMVSGIKDHIMKEKVLVSTSLCGNKGQSDILTYRANVLTL